MSKIVKEKHQTQIPLSNSNSNSQTSNPKYSDNSDEGVQPRVNTETKHNKEEKKIKSINKKKKIQQTTQQISSGERKQLNEQILELLQNQYLCNAFITLSYQNQDLMMFLLESKNKEQGFVNKILLEWFQLKYSKICFRQQYIQSVQQIIDRSCINCKLIRGGQQTYEVNCRLLLKTIQIEQLNIINCQIMEINQSHNSGFIILINKGTQESNLQQTNIFIQLENQNSETQQIYNSHLQIGQHIPCVVQKIKYQSGLQDITIFGSVLKKINFKHIYIFNRQNFTINDLVYEQLIKNIQIMQKEFQEESIVKIKQYIDILQNKSITEKFINDKIKTATPIQQFIEEFEKQKFKKQTGQSSELSQKQKQQEISKSMQSSQFDNVQEDMIIVEMDLIDYLYGNVSIISQEQFKQYQQSQSQYNIIKDEDNKIIIMQLANRILKWQLFFVEFMSLNSSQKSFKNVQQILSV